MRQQGQQQKKGKGRLGGGRWGELEGATSPAPAPDPRYAAAAARKHAQRPWDEGKRHATTRKRGKTGEEREKEGEEKKERKDWPKDG